jgi:hypothetical protein
MAANCFAHTTFNLFAIERAQPFQVSIVRDNQRPSRTE